MSAFKIKQLRRIFDQVDKDKSGTIEWREYANYVKENYDLVSAEEQEEIVRDVMESVDGDGDRRLTWEEFLDYFTKPKQKQEKEPELKSEQQQETKPKPEPQQQETKQTPEQQQETKPKPEPQQHPKAEQRAEEKPEQNKAPPGGTASTKNTVRGLETVPDMPQDQAKQYLFKKAVPQLFECLTVGLLHHKPEDPVAFIQAALSHSKSSKDFKMTWSALTEWEPPTTDTAL